MTDELVEILKEMDRNELGVIAKKLGIPHWRKMKKDQRLEAILQADELAVREIVNLPITSWQKWRANYLSRPLVVGGSLASVVALVIALVVCFRDPSQQLLHQGRHIQQDLDAVKVLLGDASELLSKPRPSIGDLPSDPEIERLGHRLAVVLGDVAEQLGKRNVSAGRAGMLQLAKATVALSRGEYGSVMTLLPAEQQRYEQAMTDAQIEWEVRFCLIRGHALMGMHEWREALACFERLRRLRPASLGIRYNLASCLCKLRRLDEALGQISGVVSTLTGLVEGEGRSDLADELGGSLNLRGVVMLGLGELATAKKDFDAAITIQQGLADEDDAVEGAGHLATSLDNRGVTLWLMGRAGEAISDLTRAVGIQTRLAEGKGTVELRSHLAGALGNRAAALLDVAEFDKATEDLDQAVKIARRLVEIEGRKELEGELARSLTNRGLCLGRQAEFDRAIKDDEEAVKIFTKLVEREGRVELADSQASALAGRAETLFGLGKPSEAIRDVSKAIEILRVLVKKGGQDGLSPDLARALWGRAKILQRQGRREEAKRDYQEAKRYRKLSGQRRQPWDLNMRMNPHEWRGTKAADARQAPTTEEAGATTQKDLSPSP